MTRNLYELVFEVTETLQNGKERRIKKSVYSEKFGADRKHIVESVRIKAATEALKELHYYDIEYIETKNARLIFA